MSVAAKSSQNGGSECCRNCSGDIYGQYAITSVSHGGRIFDIQEIGDPNIQKNCDKPLESEAEEKLKNELKKRLKDAVHGRLSALASAGYYLEKGQIYKGGASFDATICVDDGEVSVTINEFNLHTFA